MSELAVPDPRQVALARIPELVPQIAQVRERALADNDLPAADELRRRLDGYEKYVADRKAREILLPELRRTEAAVGKLNPKRQGVTSPLTGEVHDDILAEFRLMAEYEDVLEATLAEGKNKRAQIIAAIRRHLFIAPPFPDGKYQCVVLDPPWPIEKIQREERHYQADLDYPTMSLDELAALPISDLAHEDGCHMYLWVTHRFLPAGLELMRGWGFRYQCLFTWVKNVGITPFSWMYDTEHVLFGRQGSLALAQQGLRLSFSAPVTGHSMKPSVFYERVVAASPGPRLAMFERGDRPGFQVWGDEVAA